MKKEFFKSLLEEDKDEFNKVLKEILLERLEEKAYQLYEKELPKLINKYRNKDI